MIFQEIEIDEKLVRCEPGEVDMGQENSPYIIWFCEMAKEIIFC